LSSLPSTLQTVKRGLLIIINDKLLWLNVMAIRLIFL
jgi:hypothetical protein